MEREEEEVIIDSTGYESLSNVDSDAEDTEEITVMRVDKLRKRKKTNGKNVRMQNTSSETLLNPFIGSGMNTPYTGTQQTFLSDEKKYHSDTYEKVRRKFYLIIYGMIYGIIFPFYFFYLSILRLKRRINRRRELIPEGDRINSLESSIRVVRENRIRQWTRRTWRNRRKYYRKGAIAIFVAVTVFILFSYSYEYILVAISPRSTKGVSIVDDLGRKIDNVMELTLLTKEHPPDEYLAKYMTAPELSGKFKTITDKDIENGFVEVDVPSVSVSLEYIVETTNVSLIDIYHKMLGYVESEVMFTKLKRPTEAICICGMHYAIPLNIVMLPDSKKDFNSRLSKEDEQKLYTQWTSALAPLTFNSISAKTKMMKLVETLVHKHYLTFMINPIATGGSKDILTARASDLLSTKGDKIDIRFPRSIWVIYKDITGAQHKTTLSGVQSMCMVRCINVAVKDDIVDPFGKGGILEMEIH